MSLLATAPLHTNGSTHDQQPQTSPRKRKLSPEEGQSGKKKQSAPTIDSEGFKVPALPPAPAAAPSAVSNIKDIDHLNTVFIANLAFEVPEDTIRAALAAAGPIKEIRIVKHEWSGKSKGYGYVDFVDTDGCRQALKLDHTLINGRPIYISAYDPNKSASNDMTKKFKYATTLEQNKLFLSALPFTATKEQIEQVFQQHGFHPISIRLVTHKSGKSKGLAYAEFSNAQEASQAVLKVDGFQLDGHTIKVAISNPPQRKEPTAGGSLLTPRAASLGAGPKPTGPRGKGYSQISLVPRKVTSTTTSAAPTGDSASTTSSKMSNDDFRKMLSSKK